MTKKIMISSLRDIKNIAAIASHYNRPISICSDWITANAKSILGLYTLKFGKPLDLIVDDKIDEKQIEKDFERYLIKRTA